MDPVLEALLPLAAIDERVRALAEQRRRLERKLDKLRSEDDTRRAAVETLTATMAERRKAVTALEAEMRRFEQQRDRAVRALEMGMGDAAAAERQRQTCAHRIDDLETEILEAMEQREEDDEALAARTEEAAAAAAAREEGEATMGPELEGVIAESARLVASREEHTPNLPAYEREQYRRLLARKKYALARMVDRTCTACQSTVPYQIRNDLHQGRLVNCENCARWLYLPQEETAAP
jgi:predicted  nucleic acid-binding Zn-ribbon protein